MNDGPSNVSADNSLMTGRVADLIIVGTGIGGATLALSLIHISYESELRDSLYRETM